MLPAAADGMIYLKKESQEREIYLRRAKLCCCCLCCCCCWCVLLLGCLDDAGYKLITTDNHKVIEGTMVTSSTLPFSLLVCLSCFWVALTDIIPYKDDIIYPQHPAYLSVPKFAPKDAPNWSPGNGNSYIGRSQWIFLSHML